MSDLRRRRRVRARRSRRRRGNLAMIVAGALVALVAGGLLVGALAMNSVAESLEAEGADLKEIRLGQNTRIYDKNGDLLGIVPGETNRTVVGPRRIPQVLKDATVAIEDKRFFEHSGIEYSSIPRVVRITESDLNMVECFDLDNNTCKCLPACGLHDVLRGATDAYFKVLDSFTLAHLLQNDSRLRMLTPIQIHPRAER